MLIRAGERDEVVAASLERQVAAMLDAGPGDRPVMDEHEPARRDVPGDERHGPVRRRARAPLPPRLPRRFRHAFLDASVRPAIERAMACVRLRIEDDASRRPVVPGIPGPTTAGPLDDHAEVELGDISYGVGPSRWRWSRCRGRRGDVAVRSRSTEAPLVSSGVTRTVLRNQLPRFHHRSSPA
ncbi:hypothetical protein [Sorangium sp. So ce385]|uniref:hypothetical protein n=1 Tax=Sorangium sp. So ce385 TaxID=3133308 RepID=UPI003F5BC50B